MNGIELSRRFYFEHVRPILERDWPQVTEVMTCGMFGNGSEVVGLDDEMSRDHDWGPRVQILLPDKVYRRCGSELERAVAERLPAEFDGFAVMKSPHIACGVSVETIERFFKRFTGVQSPPQTDADWFRICEADLFHITHGVIWDDAAGEFESRRKAFAYYPDVIWKKKIADWCVYLTGRDAPYNVNRCYKRRDWASAHIFLGQALKRSMELGFLLNREYAPYTKWLYRLFVRLPKLADRVTPLLDEAMHSENWRDKVMALVGINRIYADTLHDMGLTSPPEYEGFHPSMSEIVLYQSAQDLYAQIPEAFITRRFNQTEYWERMISEVLQTGVRQRVSP